MAGGRAVGYRQDVSRVTNATHSRLEKFEDGGCAWLAFILGSDPTR